MNLTSLRRKAADNSLEVEHLLKAGRLRIPGLKAELERLAKQHAWSMDSAQPDGTREVPFARWAKVVGEFAEGGFQALRPLALDDQDASFVASLLEELNSSEGIDQLIDLFADVLDDPARRPAVAPIVVTAINLLFSVKSSPVTTSRQRSIAAAFLNKALPMAVSNTERAGILYALRGTGNAESLEVLAEIDDTLPPYAGARDLALRSIKKRIKSGA